MTLLLNHFLDYSHYTLLERGLSGEHALAVIQRHGDIFVFPARVCLTQCMVSDIDVTQDTGLGAPRPV
jgi:hypothetical protein